MADIDLFERMVADLESRGLTNTEIARLRRHCEQERRGDPCPLCHNKGIEGWLTAGHTPNADDEALEHMRCKGCGETIQLNHMSHDRTAANQRSRAS
jgi:hypothetical protein